MTTSSARSMRSSTGRAPRARRGWCWRERRGSASRRSGSPVSKPRGSVGCTSSPRGPRKSSRELRMRLWETCSRMRCRTCCPSCRPHGAARSRPRFSSRMRRTSRWTSARSPSPYATRCSCSRSAGRFWSRSTTCSGSILHRVSALAFAVRRLPDQDVRVLFARRVGDGTPVSELERAVDDHRLERVHVGPLSPGALQAILHPRLGRTLARPTLLRLHEASGGNPFFALELARGPRGRRRPDPAAARAGVAGGARQCSPRTAPARDAPWRCCSPARTAG